MKITMILLFAVALTLFGSPGNAGTTGLSAKCAVPKVADAILGSKAVFSGRVTNIEVDGARKIFTFRVDKYWKGKIKRSTKLYVSETTRYQAWYEVGGRYLVYANTDEEGKFWEGRCSPSKRLEDAKDDLKLLGMAKKPK